MDIDEVRITIVATGFEDKNAIAEPTVRTQPKLPEAGSRNTMSSTHLVQEEW